MTTEDHQMTPREAEIAAGILRAICAPNAIDDDIRVIVQEFGDRAEVVVVNMYEYVDFDIKTLARVALALGTDRINIGNKSSSRGCSSCDYGSRYEVELEAFGIIWPMAPPKRTCPDCGALHEFDPFDKFDTASLSCECGYHLILGELYGGKQHDAEKAKAEAERRALLGLEPKGDANG